MLPRKLTSQPGPADLARLNATADLVSASRRFLVCQIPEPVETGTHAVCDVARLVEINEER